MSTFPGLIAPPSSRDVSAILDSISRSSVAARGRDAAAVAWKLARSTGKAAWIAGTTFLVLGLPLLVEMQREMDINEMIQNQQDQMLSVLGTTS